MKDRYHHTAQFNDPILDKAYKVTSHADRNYGLITADPHHNTLPDSIYFDIEDAIPMCVAIIANTSYLQDTTTQFNDSERRIWQAASDLVDAYRESLKDDFISRFQDALNQAEDDWDAKCRVSRIINEYENLRD